MTVYERPIAELDALLHAPHFQRRADLVRVHRPLEQEHEYGKRQWIRWSLRLLHSRFSGFEYPLPNILVANIRRKRIHGSWRLNFLAGGRGANPRCAVMPLANEIAPCRGGWVPLRTSISVG